ncbi:helix-turn-helix domain-containing protein [Pseudogracilibacillus auburnensis]|uniref:helix-turn-helix domain-containing protein n=1 Tax=Pseudogracilibacillus auburnensis TaxID=1494959 RepID=UPI001A95968B|nr:helix-turn-helix transcriptional regulator [Pseudogracilibacillus auburnensis]MBO1005647.1 helix-turn-helix transcriptional regulator [Pseudogracilibacillus auburnensis]
MNEKKVGQIIVNLRENRNWSQRELARRVGLNASVMNRIESGERPVKDFELDTIASVLDTTTDYLLGRTDNPNPPNSEFNPMDEINRLIKDYDIDQSGFFDIEKWKAMGPEEIKQLEEYFEFITSRAKNKKDNSNS